MTRIRFTAVAVLAVAVFSSSGVPAQTPAEIPPAGYSETQYVDSRGCVFIRAGVDGAVTWVPRVSRDRQQVCGQTPSVVGRTAAVSAPAPVVITPDRIIAPVRTAPGAPKRVAEIRTSPKPVAVREERIVPKHVHDAQGDTLPPIPKGYKPAFDDDRLNPHRAHMTRQGYRATQEIWSNTIPRRLLSAPQKIKEPVIVGRGKGLGH